MKKFVFIIPYSRSVHLKNQKREFRRFHEVLCGSVIPFIRKKELSNLIHQGQKYAIQFPDKFRKNIQALQLLQQKEKEYAKLTQSIKELKVVIGHQMIR